MKRRMLAILSATVLCLSMTLTASAATGSSNTSSNSSSSDSSSSSSYTAPAPSVVTAESAQPGQAVTPSAVKLAIPSADGKVVSVSLEQYTETTKQTFKAQAAAPAQFVANVTANMGVGATPVLKANLQAVAAVKGSNVIVNTMGTIKPAASGKDIYGNTVVSLGTVKYVTSEKEMLIMLMSVNADGTIEYAEGVVINGKVCGAFKGTPKVVTVLVLA